MDMTQDRDQWRALEPSGSINSWELIEELHNRQLLKKG
jgi:hypothetical protein